MITSLRVTIWVIYLELLKKTKKDTMCFINTDVESKGEDLMDSEYYSGKNPNIIWVVGSLFKKAFW